MGTGAQTPEPVALVVRRLRAELGMSIRALADASGLSRSTIGNVLTSTDPPGIHAMEALARGLGVEPGAFTEYRLAKAREALSEKIVGLDRAAATLEAFEAAQAALAASDLPPLPEMPEVLRPPKGGGRRAAGRRASGDG